MFAFYTVKICINGRMARKSERNKLYEELDAMKTAREGFISYKEFKLLVQEAEGLPKDSEWVLFFVVASIVAFLQEIQVGHIL